LAGIGPAPKPADQRARRNATLAMTQLPAEGRTGRVPTWPLGPDSNLAGRVEFLASEVRRLEREVSDRVTTAAERRKLAKLRETLAVERIIRRESMKGERALWAELWKTPQATQWEKLRWDREVAQYVRWKCRGEAGDLDAAKEARQLADRLGLNPLAMLRLRWEVEAVAAPAAAAPKATGSRARYSNLRVVQPDPEQ
jgi:hypothetical protein